MLPWAGSVMAFQAVAYHIPRVLPWAGSVMAFQAVAYHIPRVLPWAGSVMAFQTVAYHIPKALPLGMEMETNNRPVGATNCQPNGNALGINER